MVQHRLYHHRLTDYYIDSTHGLLYCHPAFSPDHRRHGMVSLTVNERGCANGEKTRACLRRDGHISVEKPPDQIRFVSRSIIRAGAKMTHVQAEGQAENNQGKSPIIGKIYMEDTWYLVLVTLPSTTKVSLSSS